SLLIDGIIYETEGYGFSSSGNRDVYKVKIRNGSYLKAAADHQVLTDKGWIRIDELKEGDSLKLSEEYESTDGVVTGIGYVGCFPKHREQFCQMLIIFRKTRNYNSLNDKILELLNGLTPNNSDSVVLMKQLAKLSKLVNRLEDKNAIDRIM